MRHVIPVASLLALLVLSLLSYQVHSAIGKVKDLSTPHTSMHKITNERTRQVFWVSRYPGEDVKEWQRRVRAVVEGKIDPSTLCKISEEWTDANGFTHQVITCRDNSETYEEMCRRHEEELAAAQEEFPCV